MKDDQTVERWREIFVGTSFKRSAPTKRGDNAYHKIDFIRDPCLDSGTARFAFVIVCEGGMS